MIKKGILWDFLGKLFIQGVTFFVSIFLARLLLPEDFALVAMAMAFLRFATIFIDFGLSSALIQKQDAEDIHYSSIFWINILLSLLIGAAFYFNATNIATFYQQPLLINIVKVLSIIFFINGLSNVQGAILKKKLDFKLLSTINIVSAVASGAIGVALALTNFGVWSIIAQYISAAIIRFALLWYATKWLPQLKFSWLAVKPLWNFSKKLFFSGILDSLTTQMDVFIIGKMFAPATLGYYSRGKSLNQLIISYSSSSLTTVLFPALSKIQDNLELVKQKVVTFFQLAALIAFYLSGLLYLISEDIIVLMFTDKWLTTVPYFRIMVLSTFVYPLSAIILTPLTSLGRSDLFLKLEVIKKIILIPTYIIGFQFGLTGFLYAMFIAYIISLGLNGYYAGKLINWHLKKQLTQVLIYGTPALVGTIIIYLVLPNSLISNHFLHLCISGASFTSYYLLINFIFKTKGALLLSNLVLPLIKKYKPIN